MVRYRIVEGDTTGNFTIDSLTGEVSIHGVFLAHVIVHIMLLLLLLT